MWSWPFHKTANVASPVPTVPVIVVDSQHACPHATHDGVSDQHAHRHAGNAFKRLCIKYDHLVPRSATIPAFVRWFQDNGEAGHHSAEDLYSDYVSICELAGWPVMPRKWFTNGLVSAGCERWRGYFRIDGRDWRPMMITIPQEPIGHVEEIDAGNKRYPKRNIRVIANQVHIRGQRRGDLAAFAA